eukprot:comp17556_c0_seq1/m.29875 comp17556_c0_seq1/g.29875  ORF comp17556_c0_seq1/g.29875 comp17556_c0_seq1/m.29875 type:complete len:368 (+) comp17556_c0_seq1:373-1476(+)
MAQQPVVEIVAHAVLVVCKCLERSGHPIKGGGLPHKLDGKARGELDWGPCWFLELDTDFARWEQLDHTGLARPRLVGDRCARMMQPHFVARHKLDVIAHIWQIKRCETLALAQLPAEGDVVLCALLFCLFVVFGLHAHQWLIDALVVIGIGILQRDWIRFFVDTGPLQVLELGLGLALPELLEPRDLLSSDLACAHLLGLRRHLDEPRQERAVVNQRLPLGVPVGVLECVAVETRVSAEQHDDAFVLFRNESEKKHILAAAVVAFEHRVAHRALFMQRNFLVSRAHQVRYNVRAAGVAARIAEPLAAARVVAAHNTCRIVDPAETACMLGEIAFGLLCIRLVVAFHFFFGKVELLAHLKINVVLGHL